MTNVKPTKQFPVTVVPYRPYFKILLIFGLSFTFLLAIIGSFLVGRYYSSNGSDLPSGEYDNLAQKYQDKIVEIARLEQQVANLRLATEVDRKANEEVRAQVVDLKNQLAAMEQDNTFYRSLMRPDSNDQGLIVDAPSVEIVPGEKGKYRYNLVIKQIVTQHQQLSGYLEFELLGRQGDGLRKLALKDVSSAVTVERIKLRFKYFQRIEGEMVLPEGFVPERIELKVVVQSPKKSVVEKKFGWLVKES